MLSTWPCHGGESFSPASTTHGKYCKLLVQDVGMTCFGEGHILFAEYLMSDLMAC